MKIIAKLAGGSHLYGLNTPQSDYDERYIYMYDDVPNIIGLDKNECVDNRDGETDSLGFEVRRFMQLLRKTNTQVVEFIFADESEFTVLHPLFKKIRENRYNLIDPEQFYKSLKGYIFGEIRLANGERTGKLGGKRKEALEKYGFSPKNFCQLLRLCECGSAFFRDRIYPVNIKKYDPVFAEYLIKIKTQPELFTKEQLNEEVQRAIVKLESNYAFRMNHPVPASKYDEALANQLIFEVYFPALCKLYGEKNYDI